MSKLHELLAAEKSVTGPWHTLMEDTKKKFGNPEHFFNGHTKALKMIEESAANTATEAGAREDKPVTTTVFDTLDYALGIWVRSEDLQFQKNMTNAVARGTVMWQGKPLLPDMPVDELLGLEARLKQIRELIVAAPTLDASRNWVKDSAAGNHIWQAPPESTVKTEKVMTPVILVQATDKHPAQVEKVTKDMVIGQFTQIKRSGACTAVQKSNAIVQIDDLLVEVKQARMRANETPVVDAKLAKTLADLILQPLKE